MAIVVPILAVLLAAGLLAAVLLHRARRGARGPRPAAHAGAAAPGGDGSACDAVPAESAGWSGGGGHCGGGGASGGWGDADAGGGGDGGGD
ncbi:MAG: hypothetical protein ACOY37_02030 [Pseudomonadota bacterium]